MWFFFNLLSVRLRRLSDCFGIAFFRGVHTSTCTVKLTRATLGRRDKTPIFPTEDCVWSLSAHGIRQQHSPDKIPHIDTSIRLSLELLLLFFRLFASRLHACTRVSNTYTTFGDTVVPSFAVYGYDVVLVVMLFHCYSCDYNIAKLYASSAANPNTLKLSKKWLFFAVGRGNEAKTNKRTKIIIKMPIKWC